MGEKHLLVEGIADQEFFTACCEKAGLDGKMQIGPPTKHGCKRDGKSNAISLLPDLMQQMNDGSVTGLGLVVDADTDHSNGLGFARTKERVEAIAREYGYSYAKRLDSSTGGFYFTHADGLPEFGLWIMPDNNTDGLFEDFIKYSVIAEESKLLNQAIKTVADLFASPPEKPKLIPKFKDIHTSKAEVATWMAWQTIPAPGKSLRGAVDDNLLDFSQGHAQELIKWLRRIFAGAA